MCVVHPLLISVQYCLEVSAKTVAWWRWYGFNELHREGVATGSIHHRTWPSATTIPEYV